MTTPNYDLESDLKKRRDARSEYATYQSLKTQFKDKIHPEVTKVAMAVDGKFLTDHGPEHIDQVQKKASRLVRQSNVELKSYEIFLLLVAIHVHDVGNALGRSGHEANTNPIWDLVFGPLGFDQIDKYMATQIARVHGGKLNGDRDTIRSLDPETNWRNEKIRPQFLAAILRLADEMAEDRHRASALALELGKVKKESEVYHAYARGLHSFEPDSSSYTIDIKFAYAKSNFLRKFGKDEIEILLLDEIYLRTMKAFREAIYCSKYMRGRLQFDRVRVVIDIFDEKFSSRVLQIAYSIEDQAIPRDAGIFEFAPTLNNYDDGGPLTADRLVAILNE